MNKPLNIKSSWKFNAAAWIKLLKKKGIPSRKVTNQAILDTVTRIAAGKILDLGCGEGWLTCSLHNEGKVIIGIDATKLLIKHAQQQCAAPFYTLSFENIVAGTPIPQAPFQTIVLNFCLYEKEGTEELLQALKEYLTPDGKIIIQTLFPENITKLGHDYKSQWIENAWAGLDEEFSDPHPWYFRTMDDWEVLFKTGGLEIIERMLPASPENPNQPLSIIFILDNSNP